MAKGIVGIQNLKAWWDLSPNYNWSLFTGFQNGNLGSKTQFASLNTEDVFDKDEAWAQLTEILNRSSAGDRFTIRTSATGRTNSELRRTFYSNPVAENQVAGIGSVGGQGGGVAAIGGLSEYIDLRLDQQAKDARIRDLEYALEDAENPRMVDKLIAQVMDDPEKFASAAMGVISTIGALFKKQGTQVRMSGFDIQPDVQNDDIQDIQADSVDVDLDDVLDALEKHLGGQKIEDLLVKLLKIAENKPAIFKNSIMMINQM